MLAANELGRQTGEAFDAELLFLCAAFHDVGLLKTFSSAPDRFDVDSANAANREGMLALLREVFVLSAGRA
jgi:hypothetical protein